MPRSSLALPIWIMGLGLTLTGCREPGPAVVLGDVYLAEDPASEQSLGSIAVHLIRELPQLDSALVRICPDRGDTITTDSSARAAAWVSRGELLGAYTLRTTTATAEARFVMDSVLPGRYRLWADTVIDNVHWTWLEELFVAGDDSVRLNLTNSNADVDPFLCYRAE